eukprot:TRINITY_DN10226_c0_g1_i1.p1 TRINITY_DN10226_c0_g1~~TRINITY_DN10226_c0_g1_i1.p1  ORF type:complete len:159 (+),score=43.91 TRINITY_DN10226_c0_g1_i1:139-615(+)
MLRSLVGSEMCIRDRCHLWATGVIPIQATLSEAPVKSLVLALTITHWRVPHFWLIHRAMHPWKTDRVPDLGSWLYKNVHSLHHKSHNPTSWSGTSMHPVESTLYYSASLLVIPLMVHPTICLLYTSDAADEEDSVDLGGRRIIKKKKKQKERWTDNDK